MIALWIVYAVAVAAVVGLAAWAVERVLRAWGRPSRHVWVGALLGSLLLPVAAASLPLFPAPPAVEGADGVASEVRSRVSGIDAAVGSAAPTTSALARAVELFRPLAPRLASLDRPLGAAWLLGSGTALLLLLLGLRAMARRRSGWSRQTVEGRRVLVAPDFGPALVGVRRPEIVVPEWALRLERRLLQLVLLHEDAHRSAGDTTLLTAGVLAVAAAPWNPFLWWQLRRLRLAVEMDCDRRVIGRGVSRVAYGRLLLEVGRRQPRQGLAVAALAEPKSFLERRIRMITTRGSHPSILRAVGALSFAALLVVVACETPTPTELEGALDEAEMAVLKEMATNRPLVIVDGVIMDPGDRGVVNTIDAADVARVEVVKGAAAVETLGEQARSGVIRITTRQAAEERAERIGRLVREEDGAGRLRIRGVSNIAAGEAPERHDLGEILESRGIGAGATIQSQGPPLLIMVDGEETDLTLAEAKDLGLEIERVEILRGGAARAILGERAAGGVIQITTRDGGGSS